VKAYRTGVLLMGTVFVALGFAILIQTARHGGGTTGYLMGALFTALGAGRIVLLRRR
jgi:hypothetical protein